MCISRSRSFIHMLLICMLFSTQGLSIQHFRNLVLRTKRASENCGISKTTAITLITKGVVAEQHEFPWIVAIYNATNDFICSGTIISPNYVLTAAHCVSDPFGIPLDTTQYMIAAGKYYKDLKITDEFSQSRQIKKLTVHEDYRGVTHRYRDDIALMELDRKLQISDTIQPICMDWYSKYERNDFQNDNKGVIAGWGRNENGDYTEVLHKLDVPYWNRSICVKDLPATFERLYFTSDKFCAGFIRKNMGICHGDSGGGLIFKSDGRRYFLRGIASLSVANSGICNPNFYALYTQVSRYFIWLRDSSQDSFEINLQGIDLINRNDRNKHGCRLPKHRTNSTFILLENDRDYIEDAVIEPWKGITFSCNGNGRYKTGQYKHFYCINQQWTPSLDEVYCIRQCESLLSTHTYNIYCYHNGQNVSCEDAIEGTRAETQCKPSYEFFGKRSTSTCINGLWDSYLSPCTPISQSTTTGQPDSINGCITPTHKPNGRYSYIDGKPYVPNVYTDESTLVILDCNPGYRLSGYTYSYCLNKGWLPDLRKASCIRTCESLTTSDTFNAYCNIHGQNVSCKDAQEGTSAKLECTPFYVFHGTRINPLCTNGYWDPYPTPCEPECGKKIVNAEELVIGGSTALAGEYPWIVAIYRTQDKEQQCGGTIISRFFVLSAAQCFANEKGEKFPEENYIIVAGKYNRDFNVTEAGIQVREIKRLWIHDDYRGYLQKYRDDIAIVEVDKFDMTLTVRPVCMDWSNQYEDNDFTENNIGVVVGWGSSTPAKVLKKLLVPFRSKEVCKMHMDPDFYQQYYASDRICAGYKDNGTSVCRGDHGSGLYFQSQPAIFYIRGIVSVIKRENRWCDSNHYAFYTKVSKYLSWIETITRRKV